MQSRVFKLCSAAGLVLAAAGAFAQVSVSMNVPGIGLLADAVGCAKAGKKVLEDSYNIQLMLGTVLRNVEVALCGTCMNACGLRDKELIDGGRRSTLAQHADGTVESDKVLVF
jgi:sulfur relay (sulfurtransferase) complex TusBCD TusD component (DsrE family)